MGYWFSTWNVDKWKNTAFITYAFDKTVPTNDHEFIFLKMEKKIFFHNFFLKSGNEFFLSMFKKNEIGWQKKWNFTNFENLSLSIIL